MKTYQASLRPNINNDEDNQTYNHSDQGEINRGEAKGLWGKLPQQVTTHENRSFLSRIPGMGKQAINESDLVMYSETWGTKLHMIVAIFLNILIVLSADHAC